MKHQLQIDINEYGNPVAWALCPDCKTFYDHKVLPEAPGIFTVKCPGCERELLRFDSNDNVVEATS